MENKPCEWCDMVGYHRCRECLDEMTKEECKKHEALCWHCQGGWQAHKR